MHLDQPPSVKPPGRRLVGAAISRMRWTAAHDAGFTLVEVLVSALILILLSMAVLGALDATTRSSFADRIHADA